MQDASAEEYAIYSAVIASIFSTNDEVKRLVIQDVTRIDDVTNDKLALNQEHRTSPIERVVSAQHELCFGGPKGDRRDIKIALLG